MSVRIDKQKSLQKERMRFDSNWETILETAFEILAYSTWTIASILLLLNPQNTTTPFATTAVISLNILILVSWYFIYTLLKIEIPNPEKNRSLFVGILRKRFPELQINDNQSQLLRSKKSSGLFTWGKSLTVLFDENHIFINVTTLGRFETKSPFHSISNYLKLKRIEREFKAMIQGN